MISAVKFSPDGSKFAVGQEIMCNNTSYEILLYDTNSGNLIGSPTKLKN